MSKYKEAAKALTAEQLVNVEEFINAAFELQVNPLPLLRERFDGTWTFRADRDPQCVSWIPKGDSVPQKVWEKDLLPQ